MDSHYLSKVKAFTVDNAKVRYLTKEENHRLRNALKKRNSEIKAQLTVRMNTEHREVMSYCQTYQK
jgi:guanylate kinase